jgi:hypothetical protein
MTLCHNVLRGVNLVMYEKCNIRICNKSKKQINLNKQEKSLIFLVVERR